MDEAFKRTQKHLKEFVEKEINNIKYNTLKELIETTMKNDTKRATGRTPVEEAFKDNYGVYPNELKSVDDHNCWKSFKRGFEAAQK